MGATGGMAELLVFATELRLSLLAAVAGVLVGVVGAAFLIAIDLGWKTFRSLVRARADGGRHLPRRTGCRCPAGCSARFRQCCWSSLRQR